jgi:hypothetical protein
VPFEFVADFVPGFAGLGTDVDASRWGKIATALSSRVLTAEPRARVLLSSLPPQGQPRHLVYMIKPDVARTLAAPLNTHCVVPEGRWELLHQYFCKTCGAPGKKRWFPKKYLPLHAGHDIEKTPATGRSQQLPWKPTFRLFFGSPARLAGTIPVMAAGCVTGEPTPEELQELTRFDWIFFASKNTELVDRVDKLGLKGALLDPTDPARQLLSWMHMEDPKLLEPEPSAAGDAPETADASETAEAIRRRLEFTSRIIGAKTAEIRQQQTDPRKR